MTDLKLVKNAHLEKNGDLMDIIHYGTKIFSYNEKTGKSWCLQDCSPTSNRQIRHAIDFFNVNPKNMTIDNNTIKNEFSRPL